MSARRILGAAIAGAGVGGVAAFAYKGRGRSLVPSYMTDAATNDAAKARRSQSEKLDAVLRQAAFHISKHSKDAEAVCGMFDRACKETRQAAQRAIEELKQNLKEESTRIAFDGKATAKERNAYVAAYGCVAWTDAALAAVAAHGPIVEVGAGDGQWARALRDQRKLDVVAYDDGSSLPSGADGKRSSLGVTKLDGAEAAARHPDRTLLLVAPPPGPQAAKWLNAFKGDVVIYVGEGRGGAHANGEFFDGLENSFRLAKKDAVAVRPFPGGVEKLHVLERKVPLKHLVQTPPT